METSRVAADARLLARTQLKKAGDYPDADCTIYRKMKPTAGRIGRRRYTVDTSRDITPVINKIVREVNRGKEQVLANCLSWRAIPEEKVNQS